MDKKILKRVNLLIREIQRTPYEGIGKSERLKHGLSGYWSRRIMDEHRIEDDALAIAQLRYNLVPERKPADQYIIDNNSR